MLGPELRERVELGRTDLLVPLAGGLRGPDQAWALGCCAFYGDVSALRALLLAGADPNALGPNLGLQAAAFHGHWRLVQYLLEQAADPNEPELPSLETALHAALCGPDARAAHRVVQVLLAGGADLKARCAPDAPTGCLMRAARTRGETPLHRAAAFADTDTVELLLERGADPLALDAHGDSPLAWASWARRPVPLLRLLLTPGQQIHPEHRPLRENLLGDPL